MQNLSKNKQFLDFLLCQVLQKHYLVRGKV